jgi:hypothetical protein
MSAPETDPRFANDIARMKERVREKNATSGRLLAGWFVAGAVVGIGTWFCQDSMDREAGVAFGAGFLVFIVGWYLNENLCSDNYVPKCPRCGYSWEQEGGGWPPWKHCAGCGLNMNDPSAQP